MVNNRLNYWKNRKISKPKRVKFLGYKYLEIVENYQ